MNGLGGLELCRHEEGESESESCPERSKGEFGIVGPHFLYF